MDRKAHWDEVYRTRLPTEVSWYQPHAGVSLRLIEQHLANRSAPILDVGAGASVLHGELLAAGFTNLTAIEISSAALGVARAQLGESAERVRWIEGDVLDADLPEAHFALWHDRAVFHFLTDPADRAAYLRQLRRALAPGGVVILATFAEDGPTRCSGLEVQRYSAERLAEELGDGFRLLRSEREGHRTPGGAVQAFAYAVFQRVGTAGAA